MRMFKLLGLLWETYKADLLWMCFALMKQHLQSESKVPKARSKEEKKVDAEVINPETYSDHFRPRT